MTTTTLSITNTLRGRWIFVLAALHLSILLGCTDSQPVPYLSEPVRPELSDSIHNSLTQNEEDQKKRLAQLKRFETEAFSLENSPGKTTLGKSDSSLASRIVGRGIMQASTVIVNRENNTTPYVSILLEPLSAEVDEGSLISIIPVDTSRKPVNIRLNSVRRIQSCHPEKAGKYEWVAESMIVPEEGYPDNRLKTGEQYSLVVLHPPVETVERILQNESLSVKGHPSSTAEIALDLNRDGEIDAVNYRYCCDQYSDLSDDNKCTSCSSSYFLNRENQSLTWFSGPC